MAWVETTLGAVLPFKYGKNLPAAKRSHSGKFDVVTSAGVVDSHCEPFVDRPSIVIGRKGTVGSLTYCANPCWPTDTAFYTTGSDLCDLRFGYYFLQTLPLTEMNTDSAVPGLNRGEAEALPVRIPDLGKQEQISSVLGSLDDKIATNLAVVQHANALATSFVAARSGELSRASLKELTTLVSRGITPRYDDTGGYMVLNQRCIRDSQVNTALSRTMKSLPKNREKVLRQHDVLINSTGQGTLGRIARWISTAPDTSVDTHVSIVRFNPDLADPAFAGTVLATMQRQVEDLAEGSTGQTELKRDLLAGLELNLPPLEKQREVGNQLRLLDDLCQARLEENQVLAKTRDELLPLLMSGKITVKEASQEAAAAGAPIPGEENEV